MIIKSIKNQTIEISDIFMKIEFAICFFIIFSTINYKMHIASMFFLLLYAMMFIFFIYTIFKYKFKNDDVINLIMMILIIAFSFIAVIQSNLIISPSVNYYRKYIIFCSTVIFIFIVSKVKISETVVNFIFIINILLASKYIFAYFFQQRTYYAGRLTFNFANPNLTALWLLQIIMYLFIASQYFKNKYIKILIILLIVFLLYFLYETGSRTSLITLSTFLFLSLYIVMRKNKKINRFIIILLVFLPIIVVFIYFSLIHSGDIRALNFMVSQGKSLTSRQWIWGVALESIKAHLILGDYYQMTGGTGISNLHNTHIDTLASYGIIVLSLLLCYIIRIILRINSIIKFKLQNISVMAFLATIIMGMGESALFSGGQGIFIFSCSFLLLARYNFENTQYSKNTSNHF